MLLTSWSRTDAGTFGEIRNIVTEAEWHETARLIRIQRDATDRGTGEIAVVTAGTSDIPVAEEAALTAEAMGNRVKRVWDVGVAGIHRVLAERSLLQSARVAIVVAGMEGVALSSRRVGGCPGDRGAYEYWLRCIFWWCCGTARYVESCASNVTVVNIDNGFGAGFVASLINRKWLK